MWSYLFQMRPNMRQNFQKKLFLDFVLARISQFDTRQPTSPITGPTIQRHSQFVFPCSCSSSWTLLPLQESCHVNLLSFSSTWSSEVIGADCKFFQLTQCGVFLTFEESISREEIPSLPGCCWIIHEEAHYICLIKEVGQNPREFA